MSDLEASALLRNLSEDYSNNRVSFSEYRLQRKIIFQKLDEEYNQVYVEDQEDVDETQNENMIIHEYEQ